MVAAQGREGDVQIQPTVNQAADGGSSVLKLSISVQAALVTVQLTVDKLDAAGSVALGNVIGEAKELT